MYDKLFTMLNAIDTSRFVSKTQYSIKKSGLKKKTEDVDTKIAENTWLVRKHYNAESTEVLGKIPSITGLATTAALNALKQQR